MQRGSRPCGECKKPCSDCPSQQAKRNPCPQLTLRRLLHSLMCSQVAKDFRTRQQGRPQVSDYYFKVCTIPCWVFAPLRPVRGSDFSCQHCTRHHHDHHDHTSQKTHVCGPTPCDHHTVVYQYSSIFSRRCPSGPLPPGTPLLPNPGGDPP